MIATDCAAFIADFAEITGRRMNQERATAHTESNSQFVCYSWRGLTPSMHPSVVVENETNAEERNV
jgi:hypothetical protein